MSSFEEEWAQLKRETAVPTQLASAEGRRGGDGGPRGDLKTSHEVWSELSATTASLSYATQSTMSHLTRGQQGLTAGTEGFTSATAQRALHTCWRQRLEAVRDECQDVSSAMLMARNTLDAGERDTTASLNSTRDR